MGAIGGGIWHSVKGARNSPRGERLRGSITAVKSRSPVLGGNFAVWGLLFSSFDCSFSAIRRKEDPWNSIFSGAATGGVLAIRAGWRAASKNAIIGGVLLALIEGLNIFITKALSPAPTDDPYGIEAPPIMPPPIQSGSTGYSDPGFAVETEAFHDPYAKSNVRDNASPLR